MSKKISVILIGIIIIISLALSIYIPNKDKIKDLMNEWIIFRDEELCKLTKKDLKHSLNFDDFSNLVLKNVSKKSEKFMLKQLDKFYNNIMDFTGYYNDKYYRAGFGDCLNLVIMSLGGNGIETR